MKLNCPELNCQRHVLVCIYSCKETIRCPMYYKMYEQIKEYKPDEKYVEKYGEPVFPVPSVIQNRLKNQSKKEKELAKKKLLQEKEQKKADKIKAKREKEEDKQQKIKLRDYKREQKALKKKPKRTREEILEANKIKFYTPTKRKSGRPSVKSIGVEPQDEKFIIPKRNISQKLNKASFFDED